LYAKVVVGLEQLMTNIFFFRFRGCLFDKSLRSDFNDLLLGQVVAYANDESTWSLTERLCLTVDVLSDEARR
jgi:hypothetical protein